MNSFSSSYNLRSKHRTTYNNNNIFHGSIREILIYNNCLGLSDRQRIEGYLSWKWRLTSNLPTGHPFITTQPT